MCNFTLKYTNTSIERVSLTRNYRKLQKYWKNTYLCIQFFLSIFNFSFMLQIQHIVVYFISKNVQETQYFSHEKRKKERIKNKKTKYKKELLDISNYINKTISKKSYIKLLLYSYLPVSCIFFFVYFSIYFFFFIRYFIHNCVSLTVSPNNCLWHKILSSNSIVNW